jgi:ABC-type bacteriocin/lantibiotic exporter with double-glycine peptidase domain
VHDPRLPPPPPSGRRRGFSPGLFTRILTVAAGTLVLIGAVAISFVVFVVVLTALLVIGLYLWWKTRHLRRQLKERMDAQRAGAARGETIEGEAIHKRESDPRGR